MPASNTAARDDSTAVDRLIETLEHEWEGVPLERRHSRPVAYADPFLFRTAFPSVVRDDLVVLAAAVRLSSTVEQLTDDMVGASPVHQEIGRRSLLPAAFEAHHHLHRLFPSDATFWSRYRGSCRDQARARQWEQQNTPRAWRTCSPDDALAAARGKAAVATLTIAGLVELAREHSLFDVLAESVRSYRVGVQLLAELTHWRHDLRRGIPTLLLLSVARARPVANDDDNADPRIVAAYGRAIFHDGHAARVLRSAVDAFAAADAPVKDMRLPDWRDRIARSRQHCEALGRQLAEPSRARAGASRRRSLQVAWPASTEWGKQASRAVSFLCSQWQKGFPETQWFVRYPPELDPEGRRGIHSGDVFQRAVVLNALCEADDFVGGQLRDVVDSELEYLTEMRESTPLARWSYFPSMPDLPPSTNVLAEVLRAVARRRRWTPALRAAVDGALAALFGTEDGAPTADAWIIPTVNRSPTQQAQWQWRRGSLANAHDCEALPNLYATLAEHFPDVLTERPRRDAVAWIEGLQLDDGSWGPHRALGTYACLHALRWLGPESEAVARAAAFLQRTQLADGGWGDSSAGGTALDTAVALTALAELSPRPLPLAAEVAARGLRFLVQARAGDAWPAAHGVFVGQWRHGSRTFTSAWVLRATLAWERRCVSSE